MRASPKLGVPYWGGSPIKSIVFGGLYWGLIWIMEERMETTIVYWSYIGIMEKRMETTSFAATYAF